MATCSSGQNAYTTTNHGSPPQITANDLQGLCNAVAARLSSDLGGAFSCVGFDATSPYGAGSVAYSGPFSSGDYYAKVCDVPVDAPVSSGASVSCGAACTVTTVHEFSLPVLQMTPGDGAQIGFAIVLVWAVGFAFRSIIKAMSIRVGDVSSEE